ncbi:MAG: TolC family protein [Omnitrophica bacterium]|nr:TolC family protein [Candidatus Omnitrophota bacterium]
MTNIRLALVLCVLGLFALYPAGEVYAENSRSVSVLDSLIAEALANNPGIQASYNNWKAAHYRIKQVSVLPDPMMRYTYFGETLETKVGPQEHKYGVSQKVPFPGKLYLEGKMQSKRSQILREKYEAARRKVVKDIKFTYYDIYWIDKAIEITEEEEGILESLEKVAQRKYESNINPFQDVIKAQLELSKVIDKILLLKKRRKSMEARMNALLNRPKATPFKGATSVESSSFDYSLEVLHELAGENRQELTAANLGIERAKYQRSLAALDYLPDFSFGFDYIQIGEDTTALNDDGKDGWSTTFAVHVPIWLDKQVAQVREKEAILNASRKNYEDVKNNVAYEVEDIYYKITTYRDIVSLYKTALVPQSEEAFNAARTAYETGRVDFLNWLDSERTLLQTRLAYYRATVDYEKSIAYLERVVGKDL